MITLSRVNLLNNACDNIMCHGKPEERAAKQEKIKNLVASPSLDATLLSLQNSWTCVPCARNPVAVWTLPLSVPLIKMNPILMALPGSENLQRAKRVAGTWAKGAVKDGFAASTDVEVPYYSLPNGGSGAPTLGMLPGCVESPQKAGIMYGKPLCQLGQYEMVDSCRIGTGFDKNMFKTENITISYQDIVDFPTSHYQVRKLFSEQFYEHGGLPIAENVYTLAIAKDRGDNAIRTLLELYPRFRSLMNQHLITARDVSLYYKLAFNGHMPDEAYPYIELTEPNLLEDHNEGTKILQKSKIRGYMHTTHLWNDERLFHPGNEKERRVEYSTIPYEELLRQSAEQPVILRMPIGLAAYLTNRSSFGTLGDGSPEPGIYCTNSFTITKNVLGAVIYVSSYYAAYRYYRPTLKYDREARRLASIASKKMDLDERVLGLNPRINGGVGIRGNKKTREYREYLKKAAKSALIRTYPDHQTFSLKKKIDRTKDLIKRDPLTIQHISNTQIIQEHIQVTINELCYYISKKQYIKVAQICTTLYPYFDTQLLKRTRVKYEELSQLLCHMADDMGLNVIQFIIEKTGGMGLQAFAGICMYIYLKKDFSYYVCLAIDNNVAAHGIQKWNKFWKAYHGLARRKIKKPRLLFDLPMSSRFLEIFGEPPNSTHDHASDLYLHLLTGRGSDLFIGKDDDYVAKRNFEPPPHHVRTDKNLQTDRVAKWDKYFDEELDTIISGLSEAIAKRADQTPDEVYKNFIAMAPTGSVGGAKHGLEWLEDKHNANKRVWLDSVGAQYFTEVLAKEPKMQTQIQRKVETGIRNRDIVPGDIDHWLVETLCVGNLEPALYKSNEEFMLGYSSKKAFTQVLKRCKATVNNSNTVGTNIASDYADFNSLHAVNDMKKFWAAIHKYSAQYSNKGEFKLPSGEEVNYAGYIAAASLWLMKAHDSMYVREVDGDGLFHQVFLGLWSGWRTTSTINNTFNRVYGTILKKTIAEIVGFDPISESERNGDDEKSRVITEACGLLYLSVMTDSDLDAQAKKQMLDTEQTELVRRTYYQGGVYAPISRGLASFVSSDMQAPAIDYGASYARGSSAAMDELIRRGADRERTEKLRDSWLHNWTSVRYVDNEGVAQTQKLTNKDMLYVPVNEGGYGITRYGVVPDYHAANHKKWPTNRAVWELPGAPHKGVATAEKHIAKTLNSHGIDPIIAKNIGRELKGVVAQGVDRVHNSGVEEYQRQLQADHVAWQNTVHINKFAKTETRWQGIGDVVKMAMTEILEGEITTIENYKIINFSEVCEKLVGKALGVANLARGALNGMQDNQTKEKLKPWTALNRLLDVNAVDYTTNRKKTPELMTLTELYPSVLVAHYINGSYTPPRDVGGIIPPEMQILIDHVHQRVISRYYNGSSYNHEDVAEIEQCLILANQHLMQNYISKYADRFKF